jgi:arabinogalactan oligomer/maltooligosaccharide transport system permease protein
MTLPSGPPAARQSGARWRRQQAGGGGLAVGGSTPGLLAKYLLLAVVNALAVYALFVLATNESWIAFALMLGGTAVVDYVYLSRRSVPAMYLLPGLVFLLVFQVYVVAYSGYAAFTNYGDGHQLSKDAAIEKLLVTTEQRVPDSPQYGLNVLTQDDELFFLATTPGGEVLLGSADEIAEPVEPSELERDDAGTAVSVEGYTTLQFADILQRQDEITKMRVPLGPAEESAGSLRTTDGSHAFEYRPVLTYDADADTMTDQQTGVVYRDTGDGAFISNDGAELEPGWKVVVGFDNFTRLISNDSIRGPFVGVLLWTFAFAFSSVALTFIVGLGLALVLNEPTMKGRRTYRSLLLLPYAIPAFLSALIFQGMLNTDFGFVNEVLLGGASVPWLTDVWLAKFSIIFLNTWLGFPYMFLVCTGALQAIPDDMVDAARVDGAGAWRILRSIKMPWILVATGPLLIASFAFNFNNFSVVYMLTRGGPQILSADISVGSTDILITMVYKLAFGGSDRQFGFAMAVSILIFIIIATISIIGFHRTRVLEELT